MCGDLSEPVMRFRFRFGCDYKVVLFQLFLAAFLAFLVVSFSKYKDVFLLVA